MEKNDLCLIGVNDVRWKDQDNFEEEGIMYTNREVRVLKFERIVATVMKKWIHTNDGIDYTKFIKVEACTVYIK